MSINLLFYIAFLSILVLLVAEEGKKPVSQVYSGQSLHPTHKPSLNRAHTLHQSDPANHILAAHRPNEQDNDLGEVTRLTNILMLIKQTDKLHAGFLFFALIWRMVGIYEINEASGLPATFDLLRFSTRLGIYALMALNAGGFVLNCLPSPPAQGGKGRAFAHKNKLKVIVALNILREWLEGAYNLLQIALGGRGTDRALYQGRLLMNVWWSLLCLSFLRTRWTNKAENSKAADIYWKMQKEAQEKKW